ncbi:acyltransferase 3 [Xylariales sp. AK1849]|nr:acyltransferase 3 [Xylariales sp. AK1849]
MNGIRGIACLVVFNCHVTGFYYAASGIAYGTSPADENHMITQLPIVNIIYGGKGMVCIFFVLSGFVLAYSPLRKITAASPSSMEDLVSGLCSSLIRRGIRLFAPMIVLAFLTSLVTWHYPTFFPGHWRDGNPTYPQHLWRYAQAALTLMNPFSWNAYQPVSFNHCWTLGLEYRGSMVIFLLCVMTSRLTTRCRKLAIGLIALWAFYNGRWGVFCFLSGMFLAELRYCPLASDFSMTTLRIPRYVRPTMATVLLIPSLLLLGWPEKGSDQSEPFKTIYKLTPAMWSGGGEPTTLFWTSVGALGFLTAMENLPPAQWLFSTRPILYLGEISYSLYLIHWMIYLWLGVEMMGYFTATLGWSKLVGFYIMYFLTLALLLVASDYYWRVVDENCVRMGKVLVDRLGVHKSAVVSVPAVDEEITNEGKTAAPSLGESHIYPPKTAETLA